MAGGYRRQAVRASEIPAGQENGAPGGAPFRSYYWLPPAFVAAWPWVRT